MKNLRKIYTYFIEVINLPRSIPIFIVYFLIKDKQNINEDIKRCAYECNRNNYIKLHHLLLNNHVFRNIFFVRVREWNAVIAKLLKIFYRITVDCTLDAKFGPGLAVYHGNSSIVFADEIGKNFTVYQQVTVGRGKNVNGRDMAIIGDDVTVYAGAKIIGGITIGNNCVIGAGAVVAKDIPDNCTVVGNPARIIKINGERVNK